MFEQTRHPVIELFDHFTTTIAIGDHQVPIKVKRYSRAELEAFEFGWRRFIAKVTERGQAAPVERTPDEQQRFDIEAKRFIETSLEDAITLDEGVLRDRGAWVTDGRGVIGMFHACADVLGIFLGAIMVQNRLLPVTAKNWKSPRASEPGSDESIPARGGDRQGPTAASVVTVASASLVAVTPTNGAQGLEAESSGPPIDPVSTTDAQVH